MLIMPMIKVHLALGNGEDEVIVEEDGTGNVIDEVYYNDVDFPDDKGVSLSLNPDTLDATSNAYVVTGVMQQVKLQLVVTC